jgi:hypothetical protein
LNLKKKGEEEEEEEDKNNKNKIIINKYTKLNVSCIEFKKKIYY